MFFIFISDMAYHEQLTEDRKNDLQEFKEKKYEETTLEDKILTLCGSDCPIDSVFWNLLPFYFEKKFNSCDLISIHLNTNLTGDEIKISLFLTDMISSDVISHITAIFDLINFSVSNDWEPFCFCKEQTNAQKEGKEIIKYTFKSRNLTINSENLANENIFCIKDY